MERVTLAFFIRTTQRVNVPAISHRAKAAGKAGSTASLREKHALAGTRAIVRTCEVLRIVASAADGISITELAKSVGLPKSSAHRYLGVLESQGFVERDGLNRYRLGLGLLSLQSRQSELILHRARPFLEAIRDRFNETVNLGTLAGHRIIYLEILESTRGVRHSAKKGDEDFVHSTALGKAIASGMSEREVLELLAKTGMERRTKKTIVDPGPFLRELQTIRAKGYAVDDGENEEDARCVAVLIPNMSVPCAISVSGVAARFPVSALPEVALALRQAATEMTSTSLPRLSPKRSRTVG